MEIEELIFYIKDKESLRGISDKLIERIIYKKISGRKDLYYTIEKAKSFKELKKDSEFLIFFKEIRALLHEIYGLFSSSDKKKIYKIMASDIPIEKKVIDVLSMTLSTRERLNFYKEIYSNIFIEDPYEIMDLASGLNPISIYFSDKKPKKYYYLDISEDIININDYFLSQFGIDHEGFMEDLYDLSENVRRHYQYIFLWKTINLLEKIDFYLPRKLLSSLDFDFLVVSVSLKSIRRKRNINLGVVRWVKRFSEKIGYKVLKEYRIPNEYFIIIKK